MFEAISSAAPPIAVISGSRLANVAVSASLAASGLDAFPSAIDVGSAPMFTASAAANADFPARSDMEAIIRVAI